MTRKQIVVAEALLLSENLLSLWGVGTSPVMPMGHRAGWESWETIATCWQKKAFQGYNRAKQCGMDPTHMH